MRVLIADDHEQIRRGIQELCGRVAALEVCGEALDGMDVVEKVRSLSPDLVILDLRMPRIDGTRAASQILKEAPRTKIVIVSGYTSHEMKAAALKAGAHAFIAKDELPNMLELVIESLFDGSDAGISQDDGGEPHVKNDEAPKTPCSN